MKTIAGYDAWVASRAMAGLAADSELAGVSEAMRPLVTRLLANDPMRRQAVLDGFAAAQPDPMRLIRAIVDARPTDPPPEPTDEAPPGATLSHVRRLVADRTWPWPGWIPGGALTALASDPGVGKTLLVMSIAQRLWHGRPWPDGQLPGFPAGSRTLWLPGDYHFSQLIEVADAYGLSTDSILLNGTADEPTGRLHLDDPDALAALEGRVVADRPALVVIDTVGMSTDRNLGRPEEARQYFEPLMKIAGQTRTSFLLLTHLSKEQQALGRRIVGASRVVWKLTQPDPEGQPDRRKLVVDKSYALKPPALGMTIAAEGCTFDANPPGEPTNDAGDRGPKRDQECVAWLSDRLDPNPVRLKDLRTEAGEAGFSPRAVYQARDALRLEEYVVDGRKWWKLPPKC